MSKIFLKVPHGLHQNNNKFQKSSSFGFILISTLQFWCSNCEHENCNFANSYIRSNWHRRTATRGTFSITFCIIFKIYIDPIFLHLLGYCLWLWKSTCSTVEDISKWNWSLSRIPWPHSSESHLHSNHFKKKG